MGHLAIQGLFQGCIMQAPLDLPPHTAMLAVDTAPTIATIETNISTMTL
jgi:hypothetical protein